MTCGHCHGLNCDNAEVLEAEEHDSGSESDDEDGTSGDLPDIMWDADFEWNDEELVTEFGSDFVFTSSENVACTDMTADEELAI
jgi:hypothetical protein